MPDTLSYNMFVEQPFQTTIRQIAHLEGIGLHSGRFVRMAICPAPANNGIKFRRMDIDGQLQTVIAHASYAERARLCTRIVNSEGITLETIEHLMAAFAGVGLDNAIIEIGASEAPILDGSSQPVLDALNNVGLEILPARRKYMIVTNRFRFNLIAAHGRGLSQPANCKLMLKSNLMILLLAIKALAIAIAMAVLLPNWQPHGHSVNCGMLN